MRLTFLCEWVATHDNNDAVVWRIVVISFGILFLAEFGDGSQLATAALAAHYEVPLSVFLGAWLAEISVCTLAIISGRALVRMIPLVWVQRVGAAVFTVLTIIAVYRTSSLRLNCLLSLAHWLEDG